LVQSALGLIFFEGIALPIGDFKDGVEIDADTLIGKGAEGSGHVGHGNFTTTQGEGEPILVWSGVGTDTHKFGGVDEGF